MQAYLLDTNHAGEMFKKQSGGLKFPDSISGENSQFSLCFPSVAELGSWRMTPVAFQRTSFAFGIF
jgi:hypothetical protein